VLEYKPTKLVDGTYALKVQAKDASGNASGNNFYEVEFKVISESTITNFYPYPNPGTTNIRFVFTLTGSKAPEQLLVRIMTITGKVVKEITQDEFGPIKIGNNISAYGWDGTDNFGDRLANGVYLYQVMTRIDGQSIKKRDTAADRYVIHNTGKIYLLK
jgi:flagellar hook assembly protein FlgD